jgi:hypothetical protein
LTLKTFSGYGVYGRIGAMEDLLARTEMNDARMNIALAEGHLADGKHSEAVDALDNAGRHYQRARDMINIGQSGPILDNLADMEHDLDQLRSAIRSSQQRIAVAQRQDGMPFFGV